MRIPGIITKKTEIRNKFFSFKRVLLNQHRDVNCKTLSPVVYSRDDLRPSVASFKLVVLNDYVLVTMQMLRVVLEPVQVFWEQFG